MPDKSLFFHENVIDKQYLSMYINAILSGAVFFSLLRMRRVISVQRVDSLVEFIDGV